MRLEKLNNSDFLHTYNTSYRYMPRMNRASDLITLDQEGLGSFIKSVSGFFLDKVKSIREIFAINGKKPALDITGFKHLATPIDKMAGLDEDAQLAIKKIIVPWIPGIDQDFYQLVIGLVPRLDNIQKNSEGILESIDTYLAKIAGDEEFRASKTPSKDLIKSIKKFEEDDTKYLESIINGKQLQDHIELGKAIPNVKVMGTIHTTLQSVTSVNTVKNLENLLEKINKLVKRADGIYEMLKANNTAMSKTKIDELVQVLTIASKIVINISSLIRLYDASLKVEKAIVEKLSNVI